MNSNSGVTMGQILDRLSPPKAQPRTQKELAEYFASWDDPRNNPAFSLENILGIAKEIEDE